MGRGFQKSKGSLDGRVIKRNVERTKERDEGLHEEGEKFLRDKEALEEQYRIIEESSLSAEDKRKTLEALKQLAITREKDFEDKVEKEREKLQEEQKEKIEEYSSGIEEISEEADSLRGVKLEADSADASAAIAALDEKKAEFEQHKADAQEKLRLQIQQAEMQARNMRNKRF